jgi:transcription antitermination protein NusB
MLSRRNVRIKIMQLLYSLNRDQTLKGRDILNAYEKFIDQSFTLYLFNLFLLQDVSQYAKADEQRRKAKFVKDASDSSFSARLYENPCMIGVHQNAYLQKLIKAHGFIDQWDTDISKRIYFDFAKLQEYQDYLAIENPSIEDHVAILLVCYKFTIKDELCEELIDDRFSNWYDDKSLVIGAMKKTIKALPPNDALFFEQYKPEEETSIEFGKLLLENLLEREDELVGYIEPLLQNWDKDRVTVVDFILLKMAAMEYLLFDGIPNSVTINEYIEIAKMYSTEKSKEFINGVVDNLFDKFESKGLKKKV